MTNKNYEGNVYNIQCKHSGKVLDVYKGLKDDSTKVIQYNFNNGDNQKFLLFSLDDNSYMIGAKHSGKVFDIYGGSKDDGANLIQFTSHGSGNQRFLIKSSENDAIIEAKHSGKVLDVCKGKKDNEVQIIQYREHGGDNQRFILKKVEDANMPKPSKLEELVDVVIPRLKDFDTILPEKTDEVRVSETLIPYFCINDDTFDLATAIKKTPYYKLAKVEYWKKLYQIEFSGVFDETKKVTYKSGMSEEKNKQFTNTTSISVGADLGFSFYGLTAKLSTQISNELRISQSTTTTSVKETTIEETLTTTDSRKGKRFIVAKWCLVDKYVLERADGTIVDTWSVSNTDVTKEDAYPASPENAFKSTTKVIK